MSDGKGGRPSKYTPEHAQEALRLCSGGAVMRELARKWGVQPRTLTHWRKIHPELQAAIAEGRSEAKRRRESGGLGPRRRERPEPGRPTKAEFIYVRP